MIELIILYFLIGAALCFYSVRKMSMVNSFMYTGKMEVFTGELLFYISLAVLWPLGIDMLLTVKDYSPPKDEQ